VIRAAASGDRSAAVLFVAWVAVATGAACKTRADDFYNAVYTCNARDGGARCGTTATGGDMTCFPASQLGGEDFCAPACDPEQDGPAPPAGHTCVSAGALLRTCKPTAANACPEGLACYRTSLLGDAGVCLKSVPVCTSEGACSGERLVCGGSIVSELAPTGLTIPLAGFPCLPGNCLRDSCPPDKYCLGDGFEYERSIANLCVPKCVDGKCPPDFSCQQHLDDWICIPGVPGARCTSDEGCLLGSCVDTGVEFKMCSIGCSDDANGTEGCALLNADGTPDPFVCVHPAGKSSYCATARPFTGAVCKVGDDSDCPDGQGCVPFREGSPGECQQFCTNEHACPARGGLPHVCIQREDKFFCSPGDFGKPCRGLDSPECFPGLACLALGTDASGPKQNGSQICTLPGPCNTHEDCVSHPLIGEKGFCGEDGHCRLRGAVGVPCTADVFCGRGLICLHEKCVQGS